MDVHVGYSRDNFLIKKKKKKEKIVEIMKDTPKLLIHSNVRIPSNV